MSVADGIFLGTSAFTASGWQGSFYPKAMQCRDFLTFYAEHFDTVEIDSTFYGVPSQNTVKNWALNTPERFIFSVKVPQTITHEKVLVDCDAEFEQFLHTMDILGEKLGPIVFQFPFFNRWKFPRQAHFLAILVPFLKKLPKDYKFAVEIRNKTWLDVRFAYFLREYNVALVLQDLFYMPSPLELAQKFDPITTDWTYIRWLGDRKEIEQQTRTWEKTGAGTIGAAILGLGILFWKRQTILPKARKYGIKIEHPKEGDRVFTVDVRGSIKKVLPEGYILKVFRIYPGNNFLPIGEGRVEIEKGTWIAEQCNIFGEFGDKMSIGVYMVGQGGTVLVDYFTKATRVHNKVLDQLKSAIGKKEDYLPLLEKRTPDMIECDRVSVWRSNK